VLSGAPRRDEAGDVDTLLSRLLAQASMDAEREHRLAASARAGDTAARRELVRDSLRLVALRAVSLGRRGDDLDDALQDGALGLIAAVDRFDPDRGCRLATFAWPWISRAMQPRRPRETPSDRLDQAPAAEPVEPTEDVDALLAMLPPDLALLLRHRFRLGECGAPQRPRREVAAMLGLTPAQVRAEEVRAMRYLRGHLAKVCDRAPRRGVDPL
jgi:RNA polymerase sigma factor (sigma-70 family)